MHYPRGQMCLVCRDLMKKCSHYDFKSMYVLKKDNADFEVRCTFFKATKPRKK